MKSVAAITLLAGSAAAFAPAPVTRVESSLSYAAELDSMVGVTPETFNKVVRIYILVFITVIFFTMLLLLFVCMRSSGCLLQLMWLCINLACPIHLFNIHCVFFVSFTFVALVTLHLYLHSSTLLASVTTSQPTGHAEPNSPMDVLPCLPPWVGSSQRSLEPSTHKM